MLAALLGCLRLALREEDRALDRGRNVTLEDALDFELARDVDRDEGRLDLEAFDPREALEWRDCALANDEALDDLLEELRDFLEDCREGCFDDCLEDDLDVCERILFEKELEGREAFTASPS